MLLYYGVLSVAIGAVLLGGFLHLSRAFYLNTLKDQLVGQAHVIRVSTVHERVGGDLEAFVRDVAVDRPFRVTIIAADGQVLADSHFDAQRMENHRGRPEVGEALAGRTGTATRHSATLDANLLYVGIPLDREQPGSGVIRVAVPVARVSEAVAGFWREVILLVGVVVLLTTVFVALIARSLSGPLETLRKRTVAFEQGESFGIEPVPGPLEVRQLGQALDNLARTSNESLRQVRATAAWLHGVLDSMPSGIVVLGHDGRVAMINESAVRFLGIDIADALDHHYIRAITSPNLRRMLVRVFEGEPASSTEVTTEDGRYTIMAKAVQINEEVPVSTGLAKDPFGVLLVMHDVTDLRRADQTRRDLIANVSHELRTPVASIKGFAETLLDGSLSRPETARRHVQRINDATGRLERLVQDLLRLSRLEAFQLDLKPQPIDLAAVARRIVDRRAGPVEEQTSVHVTAAGPVEVQADPEACEQILGNLLDNAMRYTPPEGRIDVRIYPPNAEGWVKTEVMDTGSGIPPDKVDRVFERFFRVDPARDRHAGGSGLGLAIVKHLVQFHGGRVGVDSVPNQGSVFWFTLPAVKMAEGKPSSG